MKTTFISSQAISQAMRYQLLSMQQDLARSQKEVVTGTLADPGVVLGSRTGQAVSLSRDVDRLKGIADANAVIATRLKATQDSLDQVSSLGQTFLSALIAGKGAEVRPGVTQEAATAVLSAATSTLNTSVNGEHIFAGINTDAVPVKATNSAGQTMQEAIAASFQAYFGFAPTDAAASSVTGAQMQAFITSEVEPQFLGAGWAAEWSDASDQPITSRIALNETADTSISVNQEGTRKLIMAGALVSSLMGEALGAGARDAIIDRATSLVTDAQTSFATQQSSVGIAQNRVTNATDRVNAQVDLFTRNLDNLQGVDPYEASTRISSLLSQIETSYALTARLQQLSLVNFLA